MVQPHGVSLSRSSSEGDMIVMTGLRLRHVVLVIQGHIASYMRGCAPMQSLWPSTAGWRRRAASSSASSRTWSSIRPSS